MGESLVLSELKSLVTDAQIEDLEAFALWLDEEHQYMILDALTGRCIWEPIYGGKRGGSMKDARGIRGDVEMTQAEHDREISINRLEKFSRTV